MLEMCSQPSGCPLLPTPHPPALCSLSLQGWLGGAGFTGLQGALGEDSIYRVPHQPLSQCAPSQGPAASGQQPVGPLPSEMQNRRLSFGARALPCPQVPRVRAELLQPLLLPPWSLFHLQGED